MTTLAGGFMDEARLMWWATTLAAPRWRTPVATALLGVALNAMVFTMTPYARMWPFPLTGFLAIVTALAIGHTDIPNRWMVGSAIVLAILAVVAWPLSNTIGWSHPTLTGAMALWTVTMVGVVVLRISPSVWLYMLPVVSLHALVTFIQGIAGVDRPPGLTDSPNQAGALLLVGILIAVVTKPPKWWLVGLLAFALPFTGTRLSMYTGGLVLMLLGLRTVRIGQFPWLWRIVVIMLAITTAFILFWPATSRAFLPTSSEAVSRLSWALWFRLEGVPTPLLGWTWLIPHGYLGDLGAHSVPLRLWLEYGVVALVAWGGLTIYALSHALWSTSWWILFTLTVLGMLDYYGNMPTSLSLVWWTSVGLQMRSVRHG